MENLAILAALCGIPAIFFMLAAKITGGNKYIYFIGIKLPSAVSLVAIILMGLVYFRFTNIAIPNEGKPPQETKRSDTVFFDACSSCIHMETCRKCQEYEKQFPVE
jgi:hypothetical protein